MQAVKEIFKKNSDDTTTGTTGTTGTHAAHTDPKATFTPSGNSTTGTTIGNNSTVHSSTTGAQDHTAVGHTATPQGAGHRDGLADAARTATSHAPNPSHEHEKKFQNLTSEDSANATHDHKHLGAVTHDKVVHHETEEVTRQREHDRHVHHVQHHVQPVHDTQHKDTVHHEQNHPVTKIHEQHVNTAEDHKLLAGLNTHKHETTHAPKERTVVDKGEVVHENVSHHVHHVVQPVVKRDTHEHHTHHTTIPIHHTTHEAPIIHQSVNHEPMHIKDFVSGGGKLDSNLKHDTAGVLAEGECKRTVDGPAEGLASKLGLSSLSK